MTEQLWLRTSLKAAIKAVVPNTEVWEDPAPEGDSITFTCADASDENTATGYRYITRFQVDVMAHGLMADTWAAAFDGSLHGWAYEDSSYRAQGKRINARRGYDYQPNGARKLYSGGTYEIIVQKVE